MARIRLLPMLSDDVHGRTPRCLAALAAFVALGAAGMAPALAEPPMDYATLPVDPNLVTDSLAYSAAPPVMNPSGQPGISTVYTHRMNDRTISDTAATDAANAARGAVMNAKTEPAMVGSGGMITSGTSADGTQSVALLTFTQGNAAAVITFAGPLGDPAPSDLLIEYGRKQDTAILDWQQP